MNIWKVRKFLTLTAFDVTTEQGRSNERYRLALLSMIANVISRGVAMLVMVLMVRLTIPYLGAERFGVWMTIASFAGLLSFLDLGVGNALANRVSHVAANNDNDNLRKTISGGLGFLFLIGCAIAVLLFLISSFLPWQKIIKVNDVATSVEAKSAINVFALLFGLSIFSNGLQRVFAGLQQAFVSHLVSLIGSILSLFALIQATKFEANIAYLLLFTLGIQLLSNLFLLIILKTRNLVALKYLRRNIYNESRHLFHTGGLFFVLQIGTMVGWGADSIIIASVLGAGNVAVFNIIQRVYQFISQPLGIMNAPLWGAYSDAHTRGDRLFIRETLKKSMLLTFTFSFTGGVAILIFGQEIIEAWTGGGIKVPQLLISVFFVWTICETLGNAFAMFLNGCGIVREQVTTVIALTAVALPAKFIFMKEYGVIGMQTSYTIIYLSVVLLFYGYFFRKSLKGLIGV